VTVTLLALWLEEHLRGQMPVEERRGLLEALREVPQKAVELLSREDEVKRFADLCANHDDVFFIGRGIDFDLALEGQLKLKEISYVHAEAYPAGELKHGTALATQPHILEKTISNMQEVNARDAVVAAIAMDSDEQVESYADYVLRIPDMPADLIAPLAAIPLQLIAYHAAVARGTDVDKPRNLAKEGVSRSPCVGREKGTEHENKGLNEVEQRCERAAVGGPFAVVVRTARKVFNVG